MSLLTTEEKETCTFILFNNFSITEIEQFYTYTHYLKTDTDKI